MRILLLAAPLLAMLVQSPARTADWKFRGRLQLDALAAGEPEGRQLARVRRLFLGVGGGTGDLSWTMDADFSQIGHESIELRDFLLKWEVSPATRLQIGHLKHPVTSDNLTSDVDTLFTERSAFASLFAGDRQWGVAVDHMRGDWNIRVALFGARGANLLQDEFEGAAAAAIRMHGDAAPGDPVLHLAVSALVEDNSDGFRLSARPENALVARVLDTGTLMADHKTVVAAEFGWRNGPWLVQAEGGRLWLKDAARNGGTPGFTGASVQLGWVITGEQRPYSRRDGVFDSVKPDDPVTEGGAGAVELGARITRIDLDEQGIYGGRLTTYGGVASWFPVPGLRLTADWVHSNSDHRLFGKRNADHVTVRGQFEW
ncbi:MAG: porin [Sphingomonadaceae bacterium]